MSPNLSRMHAGLVSCRDVANADISPDSSVAISPVAASAAAVGVDASAAEKAHKDAVSAHVVARATFGQAEAWLERVREKAADAKAAYQRAIANDLNAVHGPPKGHVPATECVDLTGEDAEQRLVSEAAGARQQKVSQAMPQQAQRASVRKEVTRPPSSATSSSASSVPAPKIGSEGSSVPPEEASRLRREQPAALVGRALRVRLRGEDEWLDAIVEKYLIGTDEGQFMLKVREQSALFPLRAAVLVGNELVHKVAAIKLA